VHGVVRSPKEMHCNSYILLNDMQNFGKIFYVHIQFFLFKWPSFEENQCYQFGIA